MKKKALVFLADGFEEVEAVTPIDYLRRAGIELLTASVGGSKTVKSSRGLALVADTSLVELASDAKLTASVWDAIIVPGGMPGAANIAASPSAVALLKEAAASTCIIAAICAAPVVVLGAAGLLAGKRFTCYPGLEKKLSGAHWSEKNVVIDGRIISSRAAGTAAEWSMCIIEALLDKDTADKTADSVLLKR